MRIEAYRNEDKYPNNYMLEYISENPNASSETLDRLSNHGSWRVLQNIPKHPNTSAKTLDKLSRNKSVASISLINIVNHPNTATETIENLANSKRVTVSRAAKEELSKRKQQQSKGN